jgi:hypothetical protein
MPVDTTTAIAYTCLSPHYFDITGKRKLAYVVNNFVVIYVLIFLLTKG